jgi:hypothetical protein
VTAEKDEEEEIFRRQNETKGRVKSYFFFLVREQ